MRAATRLLWAKSDPFHPLWCHLIDVAVVARLLASRFGGIPELPNEFVSLIAGLHDLGKADAWFQNKSDTEEIAESFRQSDLALPCKESAWCDGQRRFRHEARSAEWVQDWLRTIGWQKASAAVIATAIQGHHGQFSTEYLYDEDEAPRIIWNQLRKELFDVLIDVIKPPVCRVERFDNASDVGARLSGLIVLADWIASNNEVYSYDGLSQELQPHFYHDAAEDEARRALERLKFDEPAKRHSIEDPDTPSFCDVWPESRNWRLRPVQQVLQDLCQQDRLPPGLVIIEAPMGEGKTEAAVYLSECWNQRSHRTGCYLALPTQATANQIHKRYHRFRAGQCPQSTAPRLVHGMSWLMDDVAPTRNPQTYGDDTTSRQIARDWFRPARRALLAPDGVGTVDQALMAALNVKFGFLRLLGLSAKTLIIDEVHAYDDFMTTILERLLAWCRTLRIPVVLLSATLAQEQKRALCDAYGGIDQATEVGNIFNRWSTVDTPYPLITSVPLSGSADVHDVTMAPPGTADQRKTNIGIRLHPGLLDDAHRTASFVVECIANGGCACVLANSVKSAQAIYEHLELLQEAGALEGISLLLFHARFPASRRNAIEENVIQMFGKDTGRKRPDRAILVATQVVEQSLDVDFDVMLSQLAPVDLLLQRCGRLWRHTRPEPERHGINGPVVHVLTPPETELDFGATERVYEREILLRTLSLLYDRTEFQLPADFRELIEGCYGGGMLPGAIVTEEQLSSAAEQRRNNRAKAKAFAKTHLLPPPSSRSFSPCKESTDEGEGEVHSYFVAQTRMGDDSLSVLMVDDDELLAVAESSSDRDVRTPADSVLRKIFLQKVNLPRWWLMTAVGKSRQTNLATPTDNYCRLFVGAGWLKNQLVLPLRGGEWHGVDAHGREFVIRNDQKLGVTREAMKSENEEWNEQSRNEADAGQLG